MDINKLKQVLKIIYPKVKDFKFKWRIDGSANLLLQGINIKIKDLDIVTEKKGIGQFRKSLSEFIIKDFFNEKKEAQSLMLDILGEEIEINYYFSAPKEVLEEIIFMDVDGMKIPLVNLQRLETFYRRIGRLEKADMIKIFLSCN